MSLKTAAISFITGSRPAGRRVLKSPPRTAVRPASSCRIHVPGACRPGRVAVAIRTPQLLGRPGWLTAGRADAKVATGPCYDIRSRTAAARRIIAHITVGDTGGVRRLPANAAADGGRVKTSDSGERAKLTDLVGWQRRELDRTRSEAAARSVIDVATGMLMERLSCSPAEARQQLDRLSSASGITPTDLAAEITGQHLLTAFAPAPHRTSPARATVEDAPDGARLAAALLKEAPSAKGAVSAAIWLMEPDGGLELAGEAGLGPREASRWRRIPPDMTFPALRAVRENTEIWWPRGRPPGDDSPLAGRSADCARAVLPLRSDGASFGALEICWPAALSAFSAPLRRQIAALADTCAQALGAGLPHTGPSAGYAAAWIFGLLDGLHESALFARAVRGDHGMVAGLVVEWVSRGFRDPAGRPA